MKLNKLIFGFVLAFNLVAYSQNTPKDVLFTINDKPYFTDEFIRVYKKILI